MQNPSVLVTGAGVFIGGTIVDRLSAEGRAVSAGVRRLPPGPAPTGRFERVACDLDEPRSLDAGLSGIDAVVHAAVGSCDRMEAETAALLQAAGRAGVDRLILFSSVAVYGERQGPVREEDGPRGRLDAYGAAKRRCEALVARWGEAPGAAGPRAVTVLRPGIVYGRGSRLWIDGLAARIRAGGWTSFGPAGEGIAALVHVDDVVHAVRLALDGASPGVSAYNLTGPDQPTWNTYFAALAARLGLPASREVGRVELAARQAVAVPAKLLARCRLPVPLALTGMPLPAEMRLFGRRAVYTTERARAGLGWTARIGLPLGMSLSLPDQPKRT